MTVAQNNLPKQISYTPTGNDPQFYVKVSEVRNSESSVTLTVKATQEMWGQIFWFMADSYATEEKSAWFLIKAGTHDYTVNLGKVSFDILRFDIGVEGIPIEVRDIQLRGEGEDNPWRYNGQYFDSESGNYYLRARYYNPQTGRFISEDPLFRSNNRSSLNIYTITQTANLYAYCANNPVRFVDPSGLVLSETDKKKLTTAQQTQILLATKAYEAASKAGNTAGMANAHAAAQAIRASAGYSGGSDGSKNLALTSTTYGTAPRPTSTTTQSVGVNTNALNSPGNAVAQTSNAFGLTSAIAKSAVASFAQNAPKPGNIGAGTWNQSVAKEVARAGQVSKGLGAASKVLGGAVVGVDVGYGVYNNIQAGASAEVIMVDAATDAAFSLGGFGTALGTSAAAGMVLSPGGAVLAGIGGGTAYFVATDVVTVDGYTLREWAKVQFRNLAGVNR